jgi:hypothetical protein
MTMLPPTAAGLDKFARPGAFLGGLVFRIKVNGFVAFGGHGARVAERRY